MGASQRSGLTWYIHTMASANSRRAKPVRIITVLCGAGMNHLPCTPSKSAPSQALRSSCSEAQASVSLLKAAKAAFALSRKHCLRYDSTASPRYLLHLPACVDRYVPQLSLRLGIDRDRSACH